MTVKDLVKACQDARDFRRELNHDISNASNTNFEIKLSSDSAKDFSECLKILLDFVENGDIS